MKIMKLVPLLLSVFLSSVCAAQGQPNSRFDGIWVGSETLQLGGTRQAEIAIAQQGRLLGGIKGFYVGRYSQVSWSGNVLVFQAGGDRRSELTLSPDGKTMMENGVAAIGNPVRGGGGGREGALSGHAPVLGTINGKLTGTFHRVK